MRRIVTGLDDAGRSCVIEETPLGTELGRTTVFQTSESPARVPPHDGHETMDLGGAAGTVDWRVVRFGPEFATEMHVTNTFDFDIVLEGTAELILEDGPHAIGPGDLLAIPGILHGWRAGPAGFTIAILLLGAQDAP
jgi:quercetin dioxygenase-like cupin family protein